VAEVEFGRYRLIEQIGRGGMGEVWRAHDTVTERIVALKVLPTQFADDAVFQERFRREARSAAALDEPHVVPIHDFGEINGRLFVTMRLIKGRDLHNLLKSDGPIDPARAVGIIDQVASALHAAHQVNLVHRDVKPSNILVADDDFAYLIDFGIARAAGQTGLTSTSTVIGTWAYMAPERVTAGQTDARADVYALACVLYECLTGSQPFGGGSLEQQIGGHIALPPPRASDRRAEVPAELDAVITKGMAKNPDDRYVTTREMARAATAALAGVPTGPDAVPPTVAAPLMKADHDKTSQFGSVADRTEQASGPSQTDLTRPAPAPYDQKSLGTKTSRKGRLIALSSFGVVVAIVAAIVLSRSSDHGSPPAPSTSPTPSALPNTGPFTGTFTAAIGPSIRGDGSPATGEADAAEFSETLHLRSACGANGCVATASTGGRYPAKDLIFDNVGGRWLSVTTSRQKCSSIDDAEVWNVISLQPQADGTMSGEWTSPTTNGCFRKRAVILTRTADTDVSLLPDPATLPARVVSPAQALHGSYDELETYANGTKYSYRTSVRTDCLRTGNQCMSFFLNIVPNDGKGSPFVFGNGTWTINSKFDAACPRGGTSHVSVTETIALPQPPQDPILRLTAHGYQEEAGAACQNSAFDETFTRTGD
jgi:serine/threonine protein kinase